jgi:hypothetical protein
VELTGDGIADVLSGTYSRKGKDMAGLLYVLPGRKDGTFGKAEPLKAANGEPLVLPQGEGENGVVDRICTRQWLCDLDGDGSNDLVVGNFRGTFAWFRGGKDGFAPAASWLQADDKPMTVAHHGDPCLADLDGDGDLDLVSGSSDGDVVWFANAGSRTAPKFAAAQTILVAPPRTNVVDGGESQPIALGEDHFRAPGSDTRVFVADVDDDGKLDLLVGDSVTAYTAKGGLAEAEVQAKHAAWSKKQRAFFQQPSGDGDDAQRKWQEGYEALEKERDAFVTEERTGYVWLLRGK